MVRIVGILGLVAALFSWVVEGSPALTLRGVNVVDVLLGEVRENQDVVVQDGFIRTIEPTDWAEPRLGNVLELRGKFLIPGLRDMHTHSWSKELFFPLYLANGITAVRDMAGSLAQIQAWRVAIAAGSVLGPDFLAAGQIVDGPRPFWPLPMTLPVSNAEEARRAVGMLQYSGSDFVKVYSLLSRESFFAVAEESKKLGIPFAGHVPLMVRAEEASNAGQRTMEHLYNIPLGGSRDEGAILKQWAENQADEDPRSFVQAMEDMTPRIIDTFDLGKAQALMKTFQRNQTWQVATLIVHSRLPFVQDESVRHDPALKYIPAALKEAWEKMPSPNDEQRAQGQKRLSHYFRLVKMMADSGVPILIGTDTPNPYIVPGFSIHQEMAMHVEAGLTPLQVLQSATIRAAEFWGQGQISGTVGIGKEANLVVLDRNPLADIRNSRSIHAVVLRGEFLGREKLDQMLREAEVVAQQSPETMTILDEH